MRSAPVHAGACAGSYTAAARLIRASSDSVRPAILRRAMAAALRHHQTADRQRLFPRPIPSFFHPLPASRLLPHLRPAPHLPPSAPRSLSPRPPCLPPGPRAARPHRPHPRPLPARPLLRLLLLSSPIPGLPPPRLPGRGQADAAVSDSGAVQGGSVDGPLPPLGRGVARLPGGQRARVRRRTCTSSARGSLCSRRYSARRCRRRTRKRGHWAIC